MMREPDEKRKYRGAEWLKISARVHGQFPTLISTTVNGPACTGWYREGETDVAEAVGEGALEVASEEQWKEYGLCCWHVHGLGEGCSVRA